MLRRSTLIATTCFAGLWSTSAMAWWDEGHMQIAWLAMACNRLFFDTTRNGKRLYCDSRTCGNRIHATRYRIRTVERSLSEN